MFEVHLRFVEISSSLDSPRAALSAAGAVFFYWAKDVIMVPAPLFPFPRPAKFCDERRPDLH
jgi:hypothetical protein